MWNELWKCLIIACLLSSIVSLRFISKHLKNLAQTQQEQTAILARMEKYYQVLAEDEE